MGACPPLTRGRFSEVSEEYRYIYYGDVHELFLPPLTRMLTLRLRSVTKTRV